MCYFCENNLRIFRQAVLHRKVLPCFSLSFRFSQTLSKHFPWFCETFALDFPRGVFYNKSGPIRPRPEVRAGKCVPRAAHRPKVRPPWVLWPQNYITGCSAVGSAPALGAGCREFESPHSDHEKTDAKTSVFLMKFVPVERVKYLLCKYEIRYAYEMCCAHGGTNFISLCGTAAKFHND